MRAIPCTCLAIPPQNNHALCCTLLQIRPTIAVLPDGGHLGMLQHVWLVAVLHSSRRTPKCHAPRVPLAPPLPREGVHQFLIWRAQGADFADPLGGVQTVLNLGIGVVVWGNGDFLCSGGQKFVL